MHACMHAAEGVMCRAEGEETHGAARLSIPCIRSMYDVKSTKSGSTFSLHAVIYSKELFLTPTYKASHIQILCLACECR
jgi:hypothetical protein